MKKYLPMIVILVVLFLNGCTADSSTTNSEGAFWSAFSAGLTITLYIGGFLIGVIVGIIILVIIVYLIIGALGLIFGD